METSFPTPTCVALRTAHVSRLLVLLREARSLGLTVIVDIERLKFADPEALAQIVSEDATKIRNCPGYVREWLPAARTEVISSHSDVEQDTAKTLMLSANRDGERAQRLR